MEHILSLGAHPDVVDLKGRAAIMKAAELGNVECFEKLAHAKANMKSKDREGKGSINCSLYSEVHEICKGITKASKATYILSER